MRLKGFFILLSAAILFMGCQKEKANPEDAEISKEPAIAAEENTEETGVLEAVNYFDGQSEIDQALLTEAKNGHSFEEPFVILNPYGTSPLTAVVIFHTEEETGGTITVKGKSSEDDITGSFAAAYDHIVPVYGLYAGDTTEVALTLEDGTAATVQVTTDSVEFDTDGVEVDMKDSSSYDYSKLTFDCDFDGNIRAFDSKGDLRWFFKEGGTLGVKPLANGHLAVPSSYTLRPTYYKSGIFEMDLLGKVYHEYVIPGGMHHDIFELSNGNLLVASDRPDFKTVEDYVIEIDRNTGDIVWELDLTDLIDPSEGGSINRTEEDWFHNNAIWYDEASDTLLLSGRHVDAILGIDRSEKKLKWILGDPDGWSEQYRKYFFQPTGDNFEWQYAQHQVSMLSNGNIMCFDNGAGRTKTTKEDQKVTGDDVFSRAVVFQIDEKNMTIRQIWEYGKELGGEFNSEWVSGAISLEKDPNNIWITSGANLYNPEEDDYDYGPADMFNADLIKSTNIVQVKNDKPVFTMKLNFLSYRTLRLSPYGEVGAYAADAQGQYLGNLGITETTDADIDVTDTEVNQNADLSLDPVKLTLATEYTVTALEDLKDSYLILCKDDGTKLVYPMRQTTTQNEKDVTVHVSGYVSPVGLEGDSYDIYVVLGGVVYKTGKRAEL